MRRLVLGCVLAPLLWAGTSLAQTDEAETIIRSQLEAIAANDWSEAYSLAAPTIQRMFPSEQRFRDMVIQAYPQIHRPRNYSFGPAETDGEEITQRMTVTGPDGKDYEAIYKLRRQPDGSLKITGVSLRGLQSLGV